MAKGHSAETSPAKTIPMPSTLKQMDRSPVKCASRKVLSEWCSSRYHTRMLFIMTALSRKTSMYQRFLKESIGTNAPATMGIKITSMIIINLHHAQPAAWQAAWPSILTLVRCNREESRTVIKRLVYKQCCCRLQTRDLSHIRVLTNPMIQLVSRLGNKPSKTDSTVSIMIGTVIHGEGSRFCKCA